MKMMIDIILLRLMFLHFAYSQYYNDYDIFDKIFNRKYVQGNFDYPDYNSDCDCGLPYPCQEQNNDYISNDDSNIEVVYVDPGQVQNIYNFIKNRINERSSTEKTYETSTEYSNTQRISDNSVETTEVNPLPTEPVVEETTTEEPNEGYNSREQDSVEEIQNNFPYESNPEEIANASSPDHSNKNSVQEESDLIDKTDLEDSEDDYPMKDSEEDRLSVKKNEDETKTTEEDPEDDDNSNPVDVLSWVEGKH